MATITPARRIALIPGDGIGVEVAASARTVLAALDERYELRLEIDEFDWSCERYLAEGALMPADGLDTLRGYDAILLGAVGWPGVPDHVSLWGLLIPIRREFAQYVNLRPVRSFDGVTSPLADGGNRPIDLVIVRETDSTGVCPRRRRSRSRCSAGAASAGSRTTRSRWPEVAAGT
jgi:tartrate dehydrogenase/decarboxylase/D-malate dehydrogenase